LSKAGSNAQGLLLSQSQTEIGLSGGDGKKGGTRSRRGLKKGTEAQGWDKGSVPSGVDEKERG